MNISVKFCSELAKWFDWNVKKIVSDDKRSDKTFGWTNYMYVRLNFAYILVNNCCMMYEGISYPVIKYNMKQHFIYFSVQNNRILVI
jgi:hypothetical protein